MAKKPPMSWRCGIIPSARPFKGPTFAPLELGYKRDQVRIFKRDMKRGKAVEFHDTDHFFFVDPRKTTLIVQMIRDFLL